MTDGIKLHFTTITQEYLKTASMQKTKGTYSLILQLGQTQREHHGENSNRRNTI